MKDTNNVPETFSSKATQRFSCSIHQLMTWKLYLLAPNISMKVLSFGAILISARFDIQLVIVNGEKTSLAVSRRFWNISRCMLTFLLLCSHMTSLRTCCGFFLSFGIHQLTPLVWASTSSSTYCEICAYFWSLSFTWSFLHEVVPSIQVLMQTNQHGKLFLVMESCNECITCLSNILLWINCIKLMSSF